MRSRWIARRIGYDGTQLRSHWILRTTGLVGDAIVAFRGSCRLPIEEVADLEDALAGSVIAADDMVHFVVERFDDGDLDRATLRQRMLASRAMEVARAQTTRPRLMLRRDGDDIYGGDRKLSISVATRGPVSTLIHLAVNVTNIGTPVPTLSLGDLGIDPVAYARAVLQATVREEASIAAARCKVGARQ